LHKSFRPLIAGVQDDRDLDLRRTAMFSCDVMESQGSPATDWVGLNNLRRTQELQEDHLRRQGSFLCPCARNTWRQKLQQARKSVGPQKRPSPSKKRSITRIPQAVPAHKDANIGGFDLVVQFSCERNSDMTSDVDNRVLGRRGARTLSDHELSTVTGGTIKVTHLPNGEVDILADT
jgi:hypothetical protein